MSAELVRREVSDGVAIVTLARGEKHNAMNDELIAQWRPALQWAIEDADTTAILLRGDGPSFCSGRDTTELGSADKMSHLDVVRNAQRMPAMLTECPKPVVAAIHGHTIGAGFEVALRADFRIAGNTLSAALPETEFGLVPDTGGTALLAMLVGPMRAKQVVMTGHRVTAEQALAWGLVSEVVPDADLHDRAFALAKQLAAGPPVALGFAKQLIDEASGIAAVRTGTRNELLAQLALFASEDRAEARQARIEDRDPDFPGR